MTWGGNAGPDQEEEEECIYYYKTRSAEAAGEPNEERMESGRAKFRSKFYYKLDMERRKAIPRMAMGKPTAEHTDPKNYLRKGGGHKRKRPDITHKCHKPELPKVPSASSLNTDRLFDGDGKGTTGNGKSIYYPIENIRKITTLETKYSNPRVAVSRYGDTRCIKNVRPIYIYRDAFGKVPNYITKKLKEYSAKKLEKPEEAPTQKCKLVEIEERYLLLKGLKENWGQLHTVYQRLSICSNAGSVIRKKNELNNQMEVLERDIRMLEEHPIIYIRDD